MGRILIGANLVCALATAGNIYSGDHSQWSGWVLFINMAAVACFAYMEGVDNV